MPDDLLLPRRIELGCACRYMLMDKYDARSVKLMCMLQFRDIGQDKYSSSYHLFLGQLFAIIFYQNIVTILWYFTSSNCHSSHLKFHIQYLNSVMFLPFQASPVAENSENLVQCNLCWKFSNLDLSLIFYFSIVIKIIEFWSCKPVSTEHLIRGSSN